MSHSSLPIVTVVAVGAVIVNEDRVLLLQRNANENIYPNLWELPSGKKEPLESCGDALTREIKEETGLEVLDANPFYVFDYQVEKPNEIRDSVQINYIAKVRNPVDVKISSEHQNYIWADRLEVSDYEVSENTERTIGKAFELLEAKA